MGSLNKLDHSEKDNLRPKTIKLERLMPNLYFVLGDPSDPRCVRFIAEAVKGLLNERRK